MSNVDSGPGLETRQSRKSRMILWWTGRLLGGLVGLVVVLALAGAVYRVIGIAIDARKYPPPGKMVDVGGYRLHLNCTGTGSPTVVLDAMGSGWSLYWTLVQPEVAKVSRVCAYDRAGLGWSDPGPTPRTGQQIADELHALLINADVAGPYVLVGHSLSGFAVRLYQSRHPHEVVGMVLVDAGYEASQFMQSREFRQFREMNGRRLPLFRTAVALGVPRLAWALGLLPTYGLLTKVPPDVRPLLIARALRTRYWSTLAEESAALEETVAQVHTIGSLGDLPLVVLTATGPVWWPALPPDFPIDQFRQLWLQMQKDLVQLSSNGRQILADKSSHFIQFDQPELVIDAIRRVVEAARQRQGDGKREDIQKPDRE